MNYCVNDIITAKHPYKDTMRLWKVVGVHLGALQQESILSVVTLDYAPGGRYGQCLDELAVPVHMVDAMVSTGAANLYSPVNNGAAKEATR
jgi:hypothetical protein